MGTEQHLIISTYRKSLRLVTGSSRGLGAEIAVGFASLADVALSSSKRVEETAKRIEAKI